MLTSRSSRSIGDEALGLECLHSSTHVRCIDVPRATIQRSSGRRRSRPNSSSTTLCVWCRVITPSTFQTLGTHTWGRGEGERGKGDEWDGGEGAPYIGVVRVEEGRWGAPLAVVITPITPPTFGITKLLLDFSVCLGCRSHTNLDFVGFNIPNCSAKYFQQLLFFYLFLFDVVILGLFCGHHWK
jgi:hypothetical protein